MMGLQTVHKARSRAPLRLGLAGGGTDVSPYSDDFGGATLNATIDRYAFASIEISSEPKIRFIADDLNIEECFPLDMEMVSNARLRLHAAVYRRMISEFGDGRPIAITLRSSVDAPAGSGLGSSSALVVALIEVFRALLQIPLNRYEIAHLAYETERIDLNLPGGKQDQYAASFGGINFIEFKPGGQVFVNPLRLSRSLVTELESSLVTCFSGVSRNSADIINQQRQGMIERNARTLESLHQLKVDTLEMKEMLLRGNIDQMAKVLERSWLAKKNTASGITTTTIETLYNVALRTGALAGKVSGAGGGGFIMFLVPPEHRLNIIRALNNSGGKAYGVQLTIKGAESWVFPNKTS